MLIVGVIWKQNREGCKLPGKKLVHVREDFIEGKFELTESKRTYEELVKNEGENNFKESKDSDTKPLIKPIIEAIHAGPTKNNTFYSVEKLKGDSEIHSGSYSWTHPYPKPMLTHHNSFDGEPIGRIHEAEYRVNTKSGKPAVIVKPSIMDKEAAQKVRDGRYLTVSIGVDTDGVTCSICGWDILEDGPCRDHFRGQEYEGQKAYWMLGNLWFDELSYVDVPADTNAMNVGIEYDSQDTHSKEAYDMKDKEVVDKTTKDEAKADESTEDTTTHQTESKSDDKTGATSEGDKTSTTEETSDQELSVEDQVSLLTDTVNSLVKKLEEKDTDDIDESGQDTKVLEEENEAMKSKVKDLESQLASAKDENKILLEENSDLQAQLHKNITETVVDLKIALGKSKNDNREDLISEHIERTYESLTDALRDLVDEAALKGRGKYGKVTNPAIGATSKEKNSEIVDENSETKEEQESSKEQDSSGDVVNNLKLLLGNKRQ